MSAAQELPLPGAVPVMKLGSRRPLRPPLSFLPRRALYLACNRGTEDWSHSPQRQGLRLLFYLPRQKHIVLCREVPQKELGISPHLLRQSAIGYLGTVQRENLESLLPRESARSALSFLSPLKPRLLR